MASPRRLAACILSIVFAAVWLFEISVAHGDGGELEAFRGRYHYSKIVSYWHKSYCDVKDDRNRCNTLPKMYKNFKIHGLWPMYVYENHNKIVPPYNDSGCSTIPPTPAENIGGRFFGPIMIEDLKYYWPNPMFYYRFGMNVKFWRYQWSTHGMCFDRSNEPSYYFEQPLKLLKTFDFRNILEQANIVPSNIERYKAKAIYDVLRRAIGYRIQIRCNINSLGDVQFLEVTICFTREQDYMDCRGRMFVDCDWNDALIFAEPNNR